MSGATGRIARRILGGRGETADLEILPLMNLFVVLIPMLLLSAVFLEMSVIRMNLPFEVAVEEEEEGMSATESLFLAITMQRDRYVVEARGMDPVAIDFAGVDAKAHRRLSDFLVEMVEAHPENEDVMIIARPKPVTRTSSA